MDRWQLFCSLTFGHYRLRSRAGTVLDGQMTGTRIPQAEAWQELEVRPWRDVVDVGGL